MSAKPRSGRWLGDAWIRWKRLAHVIGNFQARVLLTVFYFVIVPPFALIVRLLKDPLTLRRPRTAKTFWIERPPEGAPAERARRQS